MHNEASQTVAIPTERGRITIERARVILEAATVAGLVNADDSFAPVLKARLATLGLRSLAQLAPDEADDVEVLVEEFAA